MPAFLSSSASTSAFEMSGRAGGALLDAPTVGSGPLAAPLFVGCSAIERLLDHETREVELFDTGRAGVLLHDLVGGHEHVGAELLLALERRQVLHLVAGDQEQKRI